MGKPDNCFRIYFENVDGFVAPTTQTRTFRKLNNKQTYLTHLVRRLDCDVLGAVETRQQYDLLPKMMKMERQLGRELDVRQVTMCMRDLESTNKGVHV